MAIRWTVRLEGGPRTVNHAAALVGDEIYSFGGYCTGENFRKKKPIDVNVLSTVTNRWRKLEPPTDVKELECVPYQRYGHTAVSHGTKIYIWGGRNDLAVCNKLFCYDTITKKWSCPAVLGCIPGARDGHTSCIIDNNMYVLGGFVDDIDEYAEGLHALNLTTMTWRYVRTKGCPPSYRDFHSSTAVNGKMYVFGGRGDNQGPMHTQHEIYNNTLYIFDPKTSTWTARNDTSAPIGRRSLSSFAYEDKFYIFGGYNGIEKQHYNDFYYYDTIKNEWSSELCTEGERPCRRRRQACIIFGDKMFLFGGTSPLEKPELFIEEDDDQSQETELMDRNDLYVLDFKPSLRTLCLVAVIQYNLDTTSLPAVIQMELISMTKPNTITKPLARLSTG